MVVDVVDQEYATLVGATIDVNATLNGSRKNYRVKYYIE